MPKIGNAHDSKGHAELFSRPCLTSSFVGENITTRNLPLLELKAGSLLQIGRKAILRVTGLRKPCVKIGRLGKGLQAAVTMRGERFAFMKGAVMAVVIAGGKVSPGNAICVQQPAGTAKFLQPI